MHFLKAKEDLVSNALQAGEARCPECGTVCTIQSNFDEFPPGFIVHCGFKIYIASRIMLQIAREHGINLQPWRVKDA
jgi:hypothetical protein